MIWRFAFGLRLPRAPNPRSKIRRCSCPPYVASSADDDVANRIVDTVIMAKKWTGYARTNLISPYDYAHFTPGMTKACTC